MPELPEVEMARRLLAKLGGARVVRVVSTDARVFVARAPAAGRTIRIVGRRGKWLRFELDRGCIFSHLGMTGGWTLKRPDDAALPFERVRLDVEKRGKTTSARYTDARRFGRFIVSPVDIDAWNELGPDPLLEDIDEARILSLMEKRKRAVKEVLLDQSILAGVGNILAIEALWSAGLDPRTPARLMNASDVHQIKKGLRGIIRRTIEHRERELGSPGSYSKEPFRIYGRGGKPCPRCGTTLKHVVLGGRGTTYCPGCQKRHATHAFQR
jgi:formamidopyrimidine-DNA glycosylase